MEIKGTKWLKSQVFGIVLCIISCRQLYNSFDHLFFKYTIACITAILMLNQVKEMGLEKGYPAITPIPWPRVGTCTLPLAFPPSTVLQKINKQLSLAPEIYQHCRQFFSCKARTLSTPPPPPAFMGLSYQLRISYFVPASHFHLAL